MRHWLLVLLLLIAPLQAVWSAAVPYCAHEAEDSAGAAKKHFGHHEHQHQGGCDTHAAPLDGGMLPATDGDCGFCHLATMATLPAAIVSIGPSSPGIQGAESASAYRSHVPCGPERPDRSAASAAARFGAAAGFVSQSS